MSETKRKNFNLPLDLIRRINRAAALKGLNATSILILALTEYLKKVEAEEDSPLMRRPLEDWPTVFGKQAADE